MPTLNQLILDENDVTFDDARFSLLIWLLDTDEEVITQFKTSKQSKYIRIVRLTLNLLTTVCINFIHNYEL